MCLAYFQSFVLQMRTLELFHNLRFSKAFCDLSLTTIGVYLSVHFLTWQTAPDLSSRSLEDYKESLSALVKFPQPFSVRRHHRCWRISEKERKQQFKRTQVKSITNNGAHFTDSQFALHLKFIQRKTLFFKTFCQD